MYYKKLLEKIDQTSIAFLQAREGQANELLSEVFDDLMTLSDFFTPETLKILTQLLTIMHDAQLRRDYVYLVDVLRYELPKYISY